MDRIEIKASFAVDDAGTIEGIAWPFGSADRVGDVIEKGAFTGVAAPLPLLWSHDQGQVVGVWNEISETDEGLAVKGRLLIDDVPRAREVRALIREGAVSGLSIGFTTRKAAPRKGGGRNISALDLLEISAVAIPCHPGARITHAKAAGAAESQPPQEHETTMENETIENAAPDLAAIETKFAARLDQLEARMNRPAIVTNAAEAEPVEKKAFLEFARRGVERMPQDLKSALVASNDAAGGYLAPEEIGGELIKLLREYSPLRQYATIRSISAGSITYPKRAGSTAATWVAETAARTASTMSFDQVEIVAHELATFVDVSVKLLEDNSYQLESELMADLAESFAQAEGAAFINGDGDGKPMGILNASGIPEFKTGNASGFPASNPADVIISMFHAIPTLHAQNGAWAMNRKTLGVIRKWKDGEGRYLVSEPIAQGAPMTLLGRPIVEMVDMPDIAADANPIVFGDMRGYRIADRVSLAMLRDPYSLATTGQVRFHARRRVGAQLTHPDRLIKLKVATGS